MAVCFGPPANFGQWAVYFFNVYGQNLQEKQNSIVITYLMSFQYVDKLTQSCKSVANLINNLRS